MAVRWDLGFGVCGYEFAECGDVVLGCREPSICCTQPGSCVKEFIVQVTVYSENPHPANLQSAILACSLEPC